MPFAKRNKNNETHYHHFRLLIAVIFGAIFALTRLFVAGFLHMLLDFIAPFISLASFFCFIAGVIILFCDIQQPYAIGFSLIGGGFALFVVVTVAYGIVGFLAPKERNTDVRNYA